MTKPCILFADDDKTMLDLYSMKCKALNWECDLSSTSDSIISLFNAKAYDCIVLDLNFMGGQQTGLTIAKEILNVRPQTPVIIFTGYATFLVEAHLREIEASTGAVNLRLVEKPNSPELFDAIRDLIAPIVAAKYEGPERRKETRSIRRSGRRLTDKIIERPDVIKSALVAAHNIGGFLFK